MRYEFSQEIPFIGIKKGAKIVSTMFPPKATKFARNEVSQPFNLTEGNSIQFCTCPDGSIYPTKMANADPEVPDCFGGQSSMAFKQGNLVKHTLKVRCNKVPHFTFGDTSTRGPKVGYLVLHLKEKSLTQNKYSLLFTGLNKSYTVIDKLRRLFNQEDDKKSINGIAISLGDTRPTGVFIARKERDTYTNTVSFAFLYNTGETDYRVVYDLYGWIGLGNNKVTLKNDFTQPLLFGQLQEVNSSNMNMFLGRLTNNGKQYFGQMTGRTGSTDAGQFVIKRTENDTKIKNGVTFAYRKDIQDQTIKVV